MFFNNISRKIKILARIINGIGIAASVIAAIIMFNNASNSRYDGGLYAAYGFGILAVGPLMPWISSLFIYGFGHLIEKAVEIADNTSNKSPVTPQQLKTELSNSEVTEPNTTTCSACDDRSSVDTDKKKTLDELLSANLISREEYEKKIKE